MRSDPKDLLRIAAHVGRSDFVEFRKPKDPEYSEWDADDPHWQAYTVKKDGSRQVLKRQDNGDCGFLGHQGCVLPLETRPIVCRLYPFQYTEKGIDGVEDGYCPTKILAKPGQTMLDVLDMSRQDGDRWHKALYQELRAGRTYHENCTDLRPAG